ncbi:hypothetical protein GCM10010520_43660 [Rhizobium viscosum]
MTTSQSEKATIPLASGPSRRAVMIEEANPVTRSSMPAAAFITEFAIMPFDIRPSARSRTAAETNHL